MCFSDMKGCVTFEETAQIVLHQIDQCVGLLILLLTFPFIMKETGGLSFCLFSLS